MASTPVDMKSCSLQLAQLIQPYNICAIGCYSHTGTLEHAAFSTCCKKGGSMCVISSGITTAQWRVSHLSIYIGSI